MSSLFASRPYWGFGTHALLEVPQRRERRRPDVVSVKRRGSPGILRLNGRGDRAQLVDGGVGPAVGGHGGCPEHPYTGLDAVDDLLQGRRTGAFDEHLVDPVLRREDTADLLPRGDGLGEPLDRRTEAEGLRPGGPLAEPLDDQ